MKFETLTQPQIESLAKAIAALSEKGDLILLSGPLGAGKTTLARAFIRDFISDPSAEIPSPSYTLVQAYGPDTKTGQRVSHFDFFRIEDPAEVQELGLEEALQQGVVLAEWPQNAGPVLTTGGLLVSLALIDQPQERAVTIEDLGGWSDRMAALGGAMS